MSTRSLVGGLTDSGTYAVYVHNDGYPEGRLPELDAIIERDGAAKALATILSAREGGWSVLDANTKLGRSSSLGDRGRVVEGYGVAYTDAPDVPPLRFPEEYSTDAWIEYVYLISEVGPVKFVNVPHGTPPEEWSWKEHHIGDVS